MTSEEKRHLAIAACQVRIGVVTAAHGAKAGHPGSRLTPWAAASSAQMSGS